MRIKNSAMVSILIFMLFFGFNSSIIMNNSFQSSATVRESPLSDLKVSSVNWSHTEVISDNINGTKNWNIQDSWDPAIAIDSMGNIHVVWQDGTNLEGCGGDDDIFYIKYSNATGQWSHPTVISDNINGTINWNFGDSSDPAIAIDSMGNIHVVWHDNTNLEGCDYDWDIFYASYSITTKQWSHTKVISDNINGTINWNTGGSYGATLALDDLGNVHVAWQDYTNLEGCGTDTDIFYRNYSTTTKQWSPIKVISDNTNSTINWNTGYSDNPTLVLDDSGNIHVVWQDNTNFEGCGTDFDIFYSNYLNATKQWSHPKVISDNINGTKNWNTFLSFSPALAVDGLGDVHVVWHDYTNLEGCGTDNDIFYTNYSTATGQWSHTKVISDNVNGTINWNLGYSEEPSIDVDGWGSIHVAWYDNMNLEGCGMDYDIFYANCSTDTGQWSHAKVISDNINGTTNWNNGISYKPTLAIDDLGNIHVAWIDNTNLEGCGTDYDIFYVKGVFQDNSDGGNGDADKPNYTEIIIITVIVIGVVGVAGIIGVIYWKKWKE